jgi:hypothetical protein
MGAFVYRHWIAVVVVVGGCAGLSTPAYAERGGREPPAIAARELRGGGGWEREGRAGGGAAQRWDIDVSRADDGTLSGAVALDGSALMRRGTLHGRIDGQRLSGRIADVAGNHVADFVGVVGRDGVMRGSYQDRTGEVGRWSWDGPLPR